VFHIAPDILGIIENSLLVIFELVLKYKISVFSVQVNSLVLLLCIVLLKVNFLDHSLVEPCSFSENPESFDYYLIWIPAEKKLDCKRKGVY